MNKKHYINNTQKHLRIVKMCYEVHESVSYNNDNTELCN
jgi:hypothetical protein